MITKEIGGLLRDFDFSHQELSDFSGSWYEKRFKFDDATIEIIVDLESFIYVQAVSKESSTTVELYRKTLTFENLLHILQTWRQI